MKRAILAGVALLFSAGAAAADDTFVTVYNQDLGLVKQVRTLSIRAAELPLKFTDVAARLIPTSVHLRSTAAGRSIGVLEQNFEYDLVSAEKILHKYLDHPVEIVSENGDLVRGTLLSTGAGPGARSLVLKTETGIRIVAWNDRMSVNVGELPRGLITRPTLIWELADTRDRQETVEVSYLTQGMNWQAEYVGVLAESGERINLAAWVSVNNRCGATFENAALKLVAGQVHRAPQPQRRVLEAKADRVMAAAAEPGFEERAFFEYHIYELERRTTLKNNQIKQIALFPESDVACEKKFFYNPRRDPKKVEVRLLFENREAAGLGRPLPAGIFRIFQSDRDSLEFVGEDRIDHTPRNEEVKIRVGKAFDLAAERRLAERRKISTRSERQTVEIELRNGKKDAGVEIVVEEHLARPGGTIEEATHRFEKKDAYRLAFTVPVPADGKSLLRYTVLYSW